MKSVKPRTLGVGRQTWRGLFLFMDESISRRRRSRRIGTVLIRGCSVGRRGGFTLIEIIITLVIVSILVSMLYSYFGTAITRSAEPLSRMGNALALQRVMENITADYRSLYNASTRQYDLATLATRIGAEGTSQNTNYGQYAVVEKHYIKYDPFVPGVAAETVAASGDPQNLLKVTVKNTIGETLTLLFSQS